MFYCPCRLSRNKPTRLSSGQDVWRCLLPPHSSQAPVPRMLLLTVFTYTVLLILLPFFNYKLISLLPVSLPFSLRYCCFFALCCSFLSFFSSCSLSSITTIITTTATDSTTTTIIHSTTFIFHCNRFLFCHFHHHHRHPFLFNHFVFFLRLIFIFLLVLYPLEYSMFLVSFLLYLFFLQLCLSIVFHLLPSVSVLLFSPSFPFTFSASC